MDYPTTKRIPLTQGQFALIDAEDYDRVNQFKWLAMRHRATYYAARSIRVNGKKAVVMMHRLIMDVANPLIKVDHEDGNGLNNVRSNIRVATVSDNNCNKIKQSNNTSGYKGVYWHKKHQKWYASIRKDRKHIFLGLFSDIMDAARAYDVAALEYHGDFARLNLG